MEKYGTVPKRFTKAWWEYFWEYYKLHVIVSVVVISMIGISAHQLLTNPKYDVTVTYVKVTDKEGMDFAKNYILLPAR